MYIYFFFHLYKDYTSLLSKMVSFNCKFYGRSSYCKTSCMATLLDTNPSYIVVCPKIKTKQ